MNAVQDLSFTTLIVNAHPIVQLIMVLLLALSVREMASLEAVPFVYFQF